MSSTLNRLAISTFVAVSFAAFAIPAVAAPQLSTLSAKPVGHGDVVRIWGRYGGYRYGGRYGGYRYGGRYGGYRYGGRYSYGYGYRRHGYGYGGRYGRGYRPNRRYGGQLLGQIFRGLHGGYGYRRGDRGR